jgi:tRNA(Arg) A34 adenosine deaminase TadA
MYKIPIEIIEPYLTYFAENNKKGFPFSACLFNKKRGILGYFVNNVTLLKDPTAHAEMMALRYLGTNFDKNEVLISSGEPCPMCLTACAWAGIKEIYYINSFKVANKKGYDFDQDCQRVNKLLKLGLKIKQI